MDRDKIDRAPASGQIFSATPFQIGRPVRDCDVPPSPSHPQEPVSGQLESRHFFRPRDTVQTLDGLTGQVVEGRALYALIRWTDGREQEIDQFDPTVEVLQRGEVA